MSKNKFTEGLKQLPDGRYRLVENLTISKDTILEKVPLKEKLTENINGKELPIYGTYVVKIWSYEHKNKNGRNYRNVFDLVLQENKVTIGYVDHPDDGAETYKDVCLVGKNPSIQVDKNGEKWLCAECTLVGKPYGENFEAILEIGGFLEFSSCADGSVDNYGMVEKEGFSLIRFFDVVVGSSNGQLFFKDKNIPSTPIDNNNILYDNDTIEENFKNDQLPQEEAPTLEENANDLSIEKEVETEKLEEEKDLTILNRTGEKTMSEKLLETTIGLSIKGMIKEANETSVLADKKTLLESALTYANELSDDTLKNSIKEQISLVEKQINEFAEKGKTVDSLTEQVNKLNEEKSKLDESFRTLTEEHKKLEENYDTLAKMYEEKQFEASETELEKSKKLNEKVEVLSQKARDSLKEIKNLKEKALYNEAQANSKVDATLVVSLKEKNEKLEEAFKVLKRKYLKLLNENKEVETKKEFLNEEVEDYYNTLLEKGFKLENLEDDFKRCKTLREAQILKMNARDSKVKLEEKKIEKDNSSKETNSALDRILAERGMF